LAIVAFLVSLLSIVLIYLR